MTRLELAKHIRSVVTDITKSAFNASSTERALLFEKLLIYSGALSFLIIWEHGNDADEEKRIDEFLLRQIGNRKKIKRPGGKDDSRSKTSH